MGWRSGAAAAEVDHSLEQKVSQADCQFFSRYVNVARRPESQCISSQVITPNCTAVWCRSVTLMTESLAVFSHQVMQRSAANDATDEG